MAFAGMAKVDESSNIAIGRTFLGILSLKESRLIASKSTVTMAIGTIKVPIPCMGVIKTSGGGLIRKV